MINGAALLYGIIVIIIGYLFIGFIALFSVIVDEITQNAKRRKKNEKDR